MEFSVDSVPSTSCSPDTATCESSGSEPAIDERRRTASKPGRSREPLEPLIVAALRSAPDRRLILADIYRYIETHAADYREPTAALPSSAVGDGQRPRSRAKEPAWKIHVRHILSVRRDVFPLTTERDGKRRGRYHALDELAYARRLAEKTQQLRSDNSGRFNAASSTIRSSTVSDASKRRHKLCSREESDRNMGGIGRLATWHLPGGPVGPPARAAATSNVEVGQI